MICAFGPCTCHVEGDTHCGPACRLGISGRGEPCKCGHKECTATEGEG
jgi:hypothetical protein